MTKAFKPALKPAKKQFMHLKLAQQPTFVRAVVRTAR
jgi:hypothetical protein